MQVSSKSGTALDTHGTPVLLGPLLREAAPGG